ncbi:MAG: BrnT family toxin [Bryobacterales bacterium]|nr:BrnT family toxin [Bryobacterales bacterium]
MVRKGKAAWSNGKPTGVHLRSRHWQGWAAAAATLLCPVHTPVGCGIHWAYTSHVASFPDDLADCTGFQWDAGNVEKNLELHRVSKAECEQVFFNRPIRVAADEKHSRIESRRAALGQTGAGRLVSVVWTVRGTVVRVISARDMSRAERRLYDQT